MSSIYRTNNISEGNNHKLNDLFNKKPSTIRLLHELRKEKGLIKVLNEQIENGKYMGKKNILKNLIEKYFF